MNCRYFLKGVWADKKAMFVAVVLICSFLNLAYMHVTVGDINPFWLYRYIWDSILFTLFDILCLFLIPFLLVRKHTWILLVPYLIITLVVWVNVGYSRYYHTYLPTTLYTATENLNGLSRNIVDAIEVSDIFLLFTTVVVFVFFKVTDRKGNIVTHRYPLYIFLTIFIIYSVKYLADVNGYRQFWTQHLTELNDKRSLTDFMKEKFLFERNVSYKNSVFKYGIIVNSCFDITRMGNNKPFPQSLKKYLTTHKANCYIGNKKKNCVLILVESLSSYPIGKSLNGVEYTPTLTRLVNNGAIYFNRMESQTQLGESGDGQFIYMTGILPFKDKVTIENLDNNILISLPKLFKATHAFSDTRMTIPTNSQNWGQANMCKKYGIDTLYSHDNYNGIADKWLNDEQLFKYAANKDIKSDKSFFSIILTSSTHSPWNKRFEDVDIPFPSNFSSELKTYLANVHYMDKWLGWYIETLKAKGIYDDTTIIIVADHKPNAPKLNIPDLNMCADIPFIIVNSPIDIATPSDERIYQTSVFPTILDLWGVDSDWRGVGYSLLYGGGVKKRDKKIQQEMSEALIYSDYFSKKKQ